TSDCSVSNETTAVPSTRAAFTFAVPRNRSPASAVTSWAMTSSSGRFAVATRPPVSGPAGSATSDMVIETVSYRPWATSARNGQPADVHPEAAVADVPFVQLGDQPGPDLPVGRGRGDPVGDHEDRAERDQDGEQRHPAAAASASSHQCRATGCGHSGPLS